MKEKLLTLGILLSMASFSQDFEIVFDEETIPVINATPETSSKYILTSMDTTRLLIIDKAREYIGVDYRYGQANEKGFDCSGYIKYVFEQFGYVIPRSSFEQFNVCKPLEEVAARPGDLIFFITRGQQISHVGIYMGNKTFIHAPGRGKKVRIESLESPYYKKHLAGFGTIF